MHTITLSDHAGDQATNASAARTKQNEEKLKAHSTALAERKIKAEHLKSQSAGAWSQRRFFHWLYSLYLRLDHFLTAEPSAPQLHRAGTDEVVWAAGSQGERKVEDFLSDKLDQRWTLVSGYRNRGGEIDKLLIGPGSIMAIEVKYMNGRISCRGDTWWRDRFDKYGNQVESDVPITDKHGRGPSLQVNAASDMLHDFLARHIDIHRITRAVVFCHDTSALGQIVNPTVDCVTTLKTWAMHNSNYIGADFGSPSDTQKVVDLLVRDHAFHNRPTRSNRPAFNAAAGTVNSKDSTSGSASHAELR